VNEVEADGADVIVDTDSHNDVPESVKRREGMAQLSNEVAGSVSKPSTDSEINDDNLS
jgi:hypothetical protein